MVNHKPFLSLQARRRAMCVWRVWHFAMEPGPERR